MLKRINLQTIAVAIALIIFTFAVFQLSTGWFTIVMSVFATLVFVLILLSPDDEKNTK